jgi:putative transposase
VPHSLRSKGWEATTPHQNSRKKHYYLWTRISFNTIRVVKSGLYTPKMPTGLTRYYGIGGLHFITCSCYHRLPILSSPRSRDIFLQVFEEARLKYQFRVLGYVVMPEHFHLLIDETEMTLPSTILQVIKQRSAKNLREAHKSLSGQVWQRRFYDFNVRTEKKTAEKLHYMHENPVRRGLVRGENDWKWSSSRFYSMEEQGTVKILNERIPEYQPKSG